MNEAPFESDEIDLRQLFLTLWQGRWLVVVTVLLVTSSAVAYALLATSWYRADVVVAPADSRGTGMNLGQLGGLASLAGISLPGATSSQAPLAVLRSNDFAREFIEDKNLGPVLFPEKWPKDATPGVNDEPKGIPDIRDAVREFTTKVRTVSEDKKSGLVTLSIRWKDAKLAAAWANELVERVNDKLRAQAQAEAERNTRYLQQQMAETTIVSLQQSMGRVLESEMQKLLLAKGNREFAFKVIDVAAVPKLRDSPKRVMVVSLGALLGLFAGCALVLLRSFAKSRP